MQAVDLFAGVSGWSLGAKTLGIETLGIENAKEPFDVSVAAGFKMIRGSVPALAPKDFPAEGLIASPPCTAFSAAGKRRGRKAIGEICQSVDALAQGKNVDWELLDSVCGDHSAHLVLEPFRWALEMSPVWMAFEQVPSVLPVWEHMAEIFAFYGYSTWTGLLSAERYGVPQTRKRAFLIASKDKKVGEPRATHRRYMRDWRKRDPDGNFIEDDYVKIAPGEDRLLPWISMAEALDINTESGADLSIGLPRSADSADASNGYRNRDMRDIMKPSLAVTGKIQSWKIRVGNQSRATVRDSSEPSPTIAFGNDTNNMKVGQEKNMTAITVEQAATLQGFPDGYPWEAAISRSRIFKCIGNSIPPSLARAVLGEATGRP